MSSINSSFPTFCTCGCCVADCSFAGPNKFGHFFDMLDETDETKTEKSDETCETDETYETCDTDESDECDMVYWGRELTRMVEREREAREIEEARDRELTHVLQQECVLALEQTQASKQQECEIALEHVRAREQARAQEQTRVHEQAHALAEHSFDDVSDFDITDWARELESMIEYERDLALERVREQELAFEEQFARMLAQIESETVPEDILVSDHIEQRIEQEVNHAESYFYPQLRFSIYAPKFGNTKFSDVKFGNIKLRKDVAQVPAGEKGRKTRKYFDAKLAKELRSRNKVSHALSSTRFESESCAF